MTTRKEAHASVIASAGPVVATADVDLTDIDMQGFMGLQLLFAIGIGGITFDGTNYLDLVVRHSDDGVTYTDVEADDLTGGPDVVGTGGVIDTVQDAQAAAATYRVGYVGSKRYVEASVKFEGTHGVGTPVAITALGMHPTDTPTAAQLRS